MRTVSIGLLKKVRLFDSVKELPIERDHELQKLFLQDAEIGSDIGAVATRFSVLHSLLSNKKTEEAHQEAKNLHNAFYYIIEKINIKSFCFVAMIESINGKIVDDFSQENVKNIIKDLSKSGMKQSQVEDIVEDVKKNFKKNFDPIFLVSSESLES